MIAHLRGRLLSKQPNQAIVEAGGVGYDVVISIPTFSDLPKAGAEVALHIHTHVREDAISLFGFLRPEEKKLFEKLISVSGIGPTLAVKILSGMSTEFLVAAIRGNDLASLTKIPGVGKKPAEGLLLDLRKKLNQLGGPQSVAPPPPVEEDFMPALENPGSQRPAAERAVAAAAGAESFEALF